MLIVTPGKIYYYFATMEEKKWNPNVGDSIDKESFVEAENQKNRPYPKHIDTAVPANMHCGRVPNE